MLLKPLCLAILGLVGSWCHAQGRVYVSVDDLGLKSYTDVVSNRKPGSHLLQFNNPNVRLSTSEKLEFSRQRIDQAPKLSAALSAKAVSVARAHALPPSLLLAVMHAESHFDPTALSSAGAVGLMQIMPLTGQRYGVHTDLAEPGINLEVGARYLRDLLLRFGGNISLTLAAYNAGEGAVARYRGQIPPFAETQAYVPKVIGLMAYYRTSPILNRRPPE